MIRTFSAISIRPAAVTRLLGTVVAVLAAASLSADFVMRETTLRIPGLVKFEMDWEASVPTYFASFLLLVSAALLAVIAWAEDRTLDRYRHHWKGLSVLFLCLSVDEIASFHEGLIDPVREALGVGGIFFYAWIIPAFGFLAVFGITFWKFWRNLPPAIRTLFAVAGITFVGGAVGIEMIGGYYSDMFGVEDFIYGCITTLEETLEMMGLVVFIYALLRYLGRSLPELSLHISAH